MVRFARIRKIPYKCFRNVLRFLKICLTNGTNAYYNKNAYECRCEYYACVANTTTTQRKRSLFAYTHCRCFSFAFICHPLPNKLIIRHFLLIVRIRPVFFGNVKKMLANLYKRLTITTNALPSIKMACDC